MTGESASWLLLAHILRPQGRKGEVLAELHTDFPERFEGGARVFLARPRFTGSASEARAVQVNSYFLPVGKNAGRVVLHLVGIDSISEAEALAGLDVIVPGDERIEPEADASYISDLLGCFVYDAGDGSGEPILIGTVDDVHFPTTPDGGRRLDDAAPLLAVLSPAGAEILIPYVKTYLLTLDVPGKRILMSLPAGLLDINA